MSSILKRTSFGLLRTNPKLTTNIKIVSDSSNRVFLESFDADPYLSKSIYKRFEVTGGSYSNDLYRFYTQGSDILPKNIAYKLYERDDSSEIKSRYQDQYDFTYDMGMEPKNSRLYTEEFSMFAPLWIEADNIPDYFLIFKMDGPVTVNYNELIQDPLYSSENLDESNILNDLVVNPTNFFENYVKKARIIKTVDLTNKSAIGQYIRRHVNSSLFPESSIYASLQKGEFTYWQGISYDNGGFCKKSQDIHIDYVLNDKTVTENDDFITLGFQNNGVVHPNILNLEFLFDDKEQENYKFSRYFGLFVSEAEMGKFEIDNTRLFNDRDYESTQVPKPIKNNVGSIIPTGVDERQYNERGIKVYPKIDNSNDIFLGRLIDWNETQLNRFPYIKDVKGNFYSINAENNWSTISESSADTNFLRLKNQTVDWNNFNGLSSPFTYIDAKKTDMVGRPSVSFKVTSTPAVDDEIRISIVDPTDLTTINIIDFYTITGDDTISAGTNNQLQFSVNGTYSQIANSISNAINYMSSLFENNVFSAISIEDRVIVYSRIESENWNSIKYSLFSTASTFPWSLPNEYSTPQLVPYTSSPVSLSSPIIGKYYEYHFTGGCNNSGARFTINIEDLYEFKDSTESLYLLTDKGYSTVGDYSIYLDEPIYVGGKIVGFNNTEKYLTYQLTDNTQDVKFTSTGKLSLSKSNKNSNGFLSIYPVNDFDFDKLDLTYSKKADSFISELYTWYTGASASSYTPTFSYSGFTDTLSPILIDSLAGPTSSFVTSGEFQSLNGLIDDFLDTNEIVTNEYDRLKENAVSELALSSKVVPFINKWVYDNESVDVRENPYRLNTDQSFGYSNFSPSFDEVSPNPKFFTHEWYYLQKYPPYMTFEEKKASFSYFDGDINVGTLPSIGSIGSTAYYQSLIGLTGASANLLSINEDYFLSYFTRETIGGTAIDRDFKYSIFEYGTDSTYSETLFRGAKILLKDRVENSPINYNIESLKLLSNVKYNGYKFSAVLTYSDAGTQLSVIKNDKWKSITLVIQSDLNDFPLLTYVEGLTNHKFIDRSSLYTLKHKLSIVPFLGNLTYSDKNITGRIYKWTKQGSSWLVEANVDANGNFPDFSSQLILNESGNYNNIQCGTGSTSVTFNTISSITSNSFICQSIITGALIPAVSTLADNLELAEDGTYISTPAAWSGIGYSALRPIFSSTITSVPSYIGGGYNGYVPILESISFSSIANEINSGNPSIKYINVDENGVLGFNNFCIELSRPDYPIKSTYLKAVALKKKPSDLQNSSSIIGYEITGSDRMDFQQIARYRGPYNPKWKSIFKFIDTDLIKSTLDINNNPIVYNNVEILSTQPDFVDMNFMKLNNRYFNKVNIEKPNVILKSPNIENSDDTSIVYPLLGQIAIDYKDGFVFKSNWDTQYYYRYPKATVSVPVIGMREPKEDKALFASKVIAIPDTIRLEKFPEGSISISTLGSLSKINTVPQNIVTNEVQNGSNTYLDLIVFSTLRLQSYLISSGFGIEFYKYINSDYSYGNPAQDDDIRQYIKENIFPRYVIGEIIFWEKFWPKGSTNPQVELNLSDADKIEAGYSKSKSFQTIQVNPDDLDFELIYNIPQDRNYSISLSVVLIKK